MRDGEREGKRWGEGARDMGRDGEKLGEMWRMREMGREGEMGRQGER